MSCCRINTAQKENLQKVGCIAATMMTVLRNSRTQAHQNMQRLLKVRVNFAIATDLK